MHPKLLFILKILGIFSIVLWLYFSFSYIYDTRISNNWNINTQDTVTIPDEVTTVSPDNDATMPAPSPEVAADQIKTDVNTPSRSETLINTINQDSATLFATPLTEENKDGKINIVRWLRDILYDTSTDPSIRAMAWEVIIDTFFNVGMQLGEWAFDNKNYTETDIFELGKYSMALADTYRTPLLISYIGLRFYPDQIDAEFVKNALAMHERLNSSWTDPNKCGNLNKLGSIMYLAEKEGFDLGKYARDYNQYFNEAFSLCRDARKSTIAFMWLAAISDSEVTPQNTAKATELIDFIIMKKSPQDRLVENLKQSYFTENKEPDTESIVLRLVDKYPKFKSYIDTF